MSRDPTTLRVAVTALNATDNPAPGVSVLRALRDAPGFRGRLIGLSYDALDAGLYARGLADAVYLVPYPSLGPAALLERLRAIHARDPFDVVLPNVDSELLSYLEIAPELAELGVGMFLPTREQLELRSKVHLEALGERSGISVPRAATVSTAQELYKLHERIPYPFFVKGTFYGAVLVHSLDEAIAAFHATVAKWGLPVIVQQRIDGEEYDVVAVGDGEGGLVGAVPMKKTILTDKGKGWGGVAVKDPGLLEMTRAFMAATRWRGPCEVEVMKDREGGYHLLEINPRFPAWVYMSAGAGHNLPWAVAQLAAGLRPERLEPYRVGTMFVRIALDQIADISDFEKIATAGELVREPSGEEEPS